MDDQVLSPGGYPRGYPRCAVGKTLAAAVVVLLAVLPCAAFGQDPDLTGAPRPQDLTPTAPLQAPSALVSPQDPREGLHFGLGTPLVEIESEELNLRLKGSARATQGVLVHMEAVNHAFRWGYARHIYRATLPDGITYKGFAVDAIGADTDQFWGFHGFRPHHSLYLGYGLAWQHRQAQVVSGGTVVATVTNSLGAVGLMADWAIGLPYALQLRMFKDLDDAFIMLRGASIQLSFMVAY